MPRDLVTVTCPPNVWTELTNSDTTAITFQVLSGSLKLRPTAGPAPTNLSDPGYVYHARNADSQEEQGERRITLSDWRALADVDRVWAMPINNRPATVLIDHA